jgi:hypothetical protein
MAEVLSEIRTNQSGSDLPWKSKMRWRRAKTGDAMGRTSWRSSFLAAPGAKFFAERSRFFGPKNEEHLRRAKISWAGADVAPYPRFPVSQGDRKET